MRHRYVKTRSKARHNVCFMQKSRPIDRAIWREMVHLDERAVPKDPFPLFEEWYQRAQANTSQPTEAFILSTAQANGKPSSRVVLLKSWGRDGFVFYTNFHSRKGRELEINPAVAMLFYWPELGQQIRIEGTAQRVSDEEARAYFITRPRASQLGAHASEQSAVIASRLSLESKMQLLETHYQGVDVPKPDYWGGYRVLPDMFEFWQNQDARLHDRLRYCLNPQSDTWTLERLAP